MSIYIYMSLDLHICSYMYEILWVFIPLTRTPTESHDSHGVLLWGVGVANGAHELASIWLAVETLISAWARSDTATSILGYQEKGQAL